MRFSIITPSFRSSQWLKLCIGSVADQGGELEHIVQDSCSDDGTQEWLGADKRVKAFVEKDSGMYDAVNRGLRRATGEILAYLNCDEQYLPGALQAVSDYFDCHPEIDVVFADTIVIDTQGDLICFRTASVPRRSHVMISHLPTYTCSTFFRRKVIDQGHFFDTKWRSHGDSDWVCRLLQAGVQMGVLRQFTSVFTCLGSNLSQGTVAQRERDIMFAAAPQRARKLARFIIWRYRFSRLLAGGYARRSIGYSIYTLNSPEKRVSRHVASATGIWNSKVFENHE